MTDGLRLPLHHVASSPGARLDERPAPSPPASGSTFRDALREAARDIATRERAIDRAIEHRGALDAEQLLALQATVQRYNQEVELAAKLVDKLTGAVRQVLTSQQ
jgi:hydroxypyruvate isomerase